LEEEMRHAAEGWSLAPIITGLMALRGVTFHIILISKSHNQMMIPK
jgi:hypothetical protein